jgi:hypothetical protein
MARIIYVEGCGDCPYGLELCQHPLFKNTDLKTDPDITPDQCPLPLVPVEKQEFDPLELLDDDIETPGIEPLPNFNRTIERIRKRQRIYEVLNGGDEKSGKITVDQNPWVEKEGEAGEK